MTGRALLLASALVAALAALLTRTADAANWLEMDFYLSGPQYEGKLPPCDYRDALVNIASRFKQRENMYWATDLRILFFEKSARPRSGPGLPTRFHAASAAGWSRSPTAANMPSTIRSPRTPG